MTRLIDADALKEKIIDLLEYEWGYEGIREDVSRIIDSMPTAEERPHGTWVKRSDGSYKCPFCCYSDWSTSNFCPNCGVKLETVGHWFPDWSESYGKWGFRCSVCARWTSEKEEKCHHCGTRMEEGE